MEFLFEKYDDYTATLLECKLNEGETEVVIPEVYDSLYIVTEIGINAFSNSVGLMSVEIPNTVLSIKKMHSMVVKNSKRCISVIFQLGVILSLKTFIVIPYIMLIVCI